MLPFLLVIITCNANIKYIIDINLTQKTWQDAEAYCVTTYESHLASVHSLSDFNEIYDLCINNISSLTGCWIGLNDITLNTRYEWTDGSNIDYGFNANVPTYDTAPWGFMEPDDSSDKNCTYFRIGDDRWSDTQCSNTHEFICNYNTVSPTIYPTEYPTTNIPTTSDPTSNPSNTPTFIPTTSNPSDAPTFNPTTSNPSDAPTFNPTTSNPSDAPTLDPTTQTPTLVPTDVLISTSVYYNDGLVGSQTSATLLSTIFKNNKLKSNGFTVEVWVVVVIAVIMFLLITVYLSIVWRSKRRKNQSDLVDMDNTENTKSIELIHQELIINDGIMTKNDDVITQQFDNEDKFVVQGEHDDDHQNNMKQKSYLNTAGNKEMNEVELWLINNCKLPKYYTIFMLNGYDSLDKIKSIQSKSQLANIGITLLGHQSKILQQIKHSVENNSPDNDITTKGVSDNGLQFDHSKDKVTTKGVTGNGLEQDDFVIGDETATKI